MRESLENIIASFIIFFDRPFTVGDQVKVNNFNGVIEKIGLRSTRIRTQEKTYISVPNKQMVDTIVDNISLRTERKIELDLQLDVATSAASLEAFTGHIRKYLSANTDITNYNVYLSESGKQFHVVHADVFVSISMDINTFLLLREKINLEVVTYANAHQIQFASSK
jgi:MscS family membrane protein